MDTLLKRLLCIGRDTTYIYKVFGMKIWKYSANLCRNCFIFASNFNVRPQILNFRQIIKYRRTFQRLRCIWRNITLYSRCKLGNIQQTFAQTNEPKGCNKNFRIALPLFQTFFRGIAACIMQFLQFGPVNWIHFWCGMKWIWLHTASKVYPIHWTKL